MSTTLMTENSNAQSEAQNNTNATAGNNAEAQNATDSNKAVEGTKEGAETQSKEPPKVEGAPEKYEAFTLPEGVSMSEGLLGKFSEMAKGLNLSQEKAQSLIGLAVEHANSLAQAQVENLVKTRDAWVGQIKADKEFGGANINETLDRAKRALGRFGSKELLELAEVTGIGDNPEFIKLLARVDRATGESKIVDGSPSKDANKSHAQRIYG